MGSLPVTLKINFWDVEFEKLDSEKNATFIIKRILDRGNTEAVLWLTSNYSEDQIKNVIKTSRDISRKTANFWAKILNIEIQEILCLKKPYSPIHFGLSS